MNFNDKRILVTGGAGAIGTNLVKRLLKEDPREVVVIDNLSSGNEGLIPIDPRVIFLKGDIREENFLRQVMIERNFDAVFHLAAQFANQNSVDFPLSDFDTNASGTLRLLEISKETGVKRFLFVSSSCVYLPSIDLLDDDSPPLATDTPYAVSKAVGEMYAKFYYNYHNFPVITVRLFNSFGQGEFPGRYRNVIPNFIAHALQGRPLPITGTGEERRTFTFVGDIVNVLVDLGACDSAIGSTVNIGSQNDVSINELASHINKITGNTAGVILKPRRTWDHVLVRKPKLVKLRKLLGDNNMISLEEGLEETIRWAKENQKKFVL